MDKLPFGTKIMCIATSPNDRPWAEGSLKIGKIYTIGSFFTNGDIMDVTKYTHGITLKELGLKYYFPLELFNPILHEEFEDLEKTFLP